MSTLVELSSQQNLHENVNKHDEDAENKNIVFCGVVCDIGN